MLKKCSLRVRLTLLTTLVITIVCVILTLVSITVARRTFVPSKISIPAATLYDPATDGIIVATPTQIQQIDAVQISEALAVPKQEFAYSNILYMVIIIIAGSIATYFVAGKALVPVKKLSDAVEAVDEDNLTLCLDGFSNHDEISRLADAFNRMAVRLENAFKQQKNFSANAAHELKTPLASLRANIEVFNLEENPSIEEYHEIIAITQRNTERLIQLVDDLLTVSSNKEFEMQKCSLNQLFASIFDDLTPIAKERDITLKIPECTQNVYGNSALLERLFYNLVLNAIKYNHKNGEVTVFIQEGEELCVVNVADSGVGILDDQKEAIFEPFYRVDKSRSRKIGGSGLGLAICKMIAEQHSATISVRDNVPQGSVFEVSIPIMKPADE